MFHLNIFEGKEQHFKTRILLMKSIFFQCRPFFNPVKFAKILPLLKVLYILMESYIGYF